MNWEPAVTVRLPYPITANLLWRTRVVYPKNGKPVVSTYVSKEGKEYKKTVGWLLRKAGVREPLTCRVRLDIQLHPHCPLDWRSRAKKDPLWWADTVQRHDLDNCRKVLTDALKGIAIVDDKQVWEDSGRVMEPRPDVEACVVLRICRGVKDNPQAALELPAVPHPLKEVAFP
jgi:crossover junction endodeoxyribonuclease RusA